MGGNQSSEKTIEIDRDTLSNFVEAFNRKDIDVIQEILDKGFDFSKKFRGAGGKEYNLLEYAILNAPKMGGSEEYTYDQYLNIIISLPSERELYNYFQILELLYKKIGLTDFNIDYILHANKIVSMWLLNHGLDVRKALLKVKESQIIDKIEKKDIIKYWRDNNKLKLIKAKQKLALSKLKSDDLDYPNMLDISDKINDIYEAMFKELGIDVSNSGGGKKYIKKIKKQKEKYSKRNSKKRKRKTKRKKK